mmetsp:Transcript_39634/g.81437  ORF Transcript_39634/g.81437 Transcript_39634/m.81437 type:complete len:130 (+) Transcript_39634:276-665(+)
MKRHDAFLHPPSLHVPELDRNESMAILHCPKIKIAVGCRGATTVEMILEKRAGEGLDVSSIAIAPTIIEYFTHRQLRVAGQESAKARITSGTDVDTKSASKESLQISETSRKGNAIGLDNASATRHSPF